MSGRIGAGISGTVPVRSERGFQVICSVRVPPKAGRGDVRGDRGCLWIDAPDIGTPWVRATVGCGTQCPAAETAPVTVAVRVARDGALLRRSASTLTRSIRNIAHHMPTQPSRG